MRMEASSFLIRFFALLSFIPVRPGMVRRSASGARVGCSEDMGVGTGVGVLGRGEVALGVEAACDEDTLGGTWAGGSFCFGGRK